jgi:hypothetical protein
MEARFGSDGQDSRDNEYRYRIRWPEECRYAFLLYRLGIDEDVRTGFRFWWENVWDMRAVSNFQAYHEEVLDIYNSRALVFQVIFFCWAPMCLSKKFALHFVISSSRTTTNRYS